MRRTLPARCADLLLAIGLATLGAACGDRPRSESDDQPITFNRDVAPLIFERCLPCHRQGGVAPFSLGSYQDVSNRARQIVEVTRSRYMPPWQPDPGYAAFDGERRLDEAEIDLLARWLLDGAAEGSAQELPPKPSFETGWQLGEPDLIVRLEEPYFVPADGRDLFRNFVLPLPTKPGQFVEAIELRPGPARVVHHATLLADTTGVGRQLDALDPSPGFAGMEAGITPGGHFVGWTPGKQTRRFGEGLAWEVAAGTDLLLQVHLLPSGKPETLQPAVGIHYTTRPPTNGPAVLHLSSKSMDIPAGAVDYEVEDTMEIPADVDAMSIYPHAHYLCRTIDVIAELPDGDQRWLIKISDWDFNWQDEYHFAEPVFLPAGSRVRMRYTFDNSETNERNPHLPPQRVTWGPRTSDSMADVWIKVVPRSPGELLMVRRAIERKELSTLRQGYELALRRKPEDFEARKRLAHILLGDGEPAAALRHLTQALAQRPHDWAVLHNLGIAYSGLDRPEDAVLYLEQALAINPTYAASHNTLASVLVMLDRLPEAVHHYRQALRGRPDNAETHHNLAIALARLGRPEEAESHFRRALELDPQSLVTYRNLAALLLRAERYEDALAPLTELTVSQPEAPWAHGQLGVAYAHLDAEDLALEHLTELLALQPEDIEARFFLATLLAASGNLAGAETELTTVLALDPDHEDARRNLEKIRRNLAGQR